MKKITRKQWETNPMDDKIDKKFKIKEDSPMDDKADKRNTGIFNKNRNKPKKEILSILMKKNGEIMNKMSKMEKSKADMIADKKMGMKEDSKKDKKWDKSSMTFKKSKKLKYMD